MTRHLIGWGVAFFLTAGMSIVLTISTCRDRSFSAEPATVEARDPAQVSDVELDLILNKVREGDLLAMREDMEGARKAWGEARRLGEGLWPIHEGLGDSHARVNGYDDAIREYQTAERLVPDRLGSIRGSIIARRAAALAAAERPLEAIQAYLECNASSKVALMILALTEKVDPEAAVELVERRAETHDPRLFSLLSALHTKLDRKDEAAEARAKFCMAIAPWDGNRNRQAIEGLRKAGKFDLAIEVCRAWVRSSPQALGAYRLMGDLHREAGRDREALVAYTSIVDVRPGDAGAHRMLGGIFRELERLDDAIDQFEAARNVRPEDREAYATLLDLYQTRGDSKAAEKVLLEISKRFGLSGELRSRVVASYMKRIDTLKAEGKREEVRAIRRKLADLNVQEAGLFDIKIIMTWDARSDVDMDVYEPGGEYIYHGHNHSKAGGHYYVDNTSAYGPETYTLPHAAPGTYKVGAHLHSGGRSAVKFVIILFEDTPGEERREETFMLEKAGERKFVREIRIAK